MDTLGDFDDADILRNRHISMTKLMGRKYVMFRA